MSGMPLQMAVVSSGDVSRERGYGRTPHTPVCAGGEEALVQSHRPCEHTPWKERARAHVCPRGDRMTIRQLRDLLATMDPDGEALVTLFHADGSAETFAIEDVTDTDGEAHIEISDEEPAA